MQEMAIENIANNEAEQNIIGGILLEPEKIKDCILQDFHFYHAQHKNIFYFMRECENENIAIDLVSLTEKIGFNRMEQVGGILYLTELATSVPTVANFSYYQDLVFQYYQKRKQQEIAQKLIRETYEKNPAEVRSDAIKALNELETNTANDKDDGRIKQGLLDLFDWLEQDHGDITGAASGFADLDRMLNGFQRKDLVIIAARPSVGKTALVLNALYNYSNNKESVNPSAIFSLETPEQSLLKRMLGNAGNIDAEKMRNPIKNFDDSDWKKATMGMAGLHSLPFHIFDESTIDVSYIRNKLRELKKEYPEEHILVAIDYLQLITGDPKHKGNRNQEVSEISRSLKLMANEFDLTIIALSQLSRGVEQRQDKRPMMSDLRESGSIEQDADVIGFLYRDDYYNAQTDMQNMIEIIIAKQRNGPIGTVTLAFIKEYGKFLNIERGAE